MENDNNFLSLEELVFINSCLFYVKATSPYFANGKEKEMLEHLSSKLMSIISNSSLMDQGDGGYEDSNEAVEMRGRKDSEGGKNLLLENLSCKINSSILYEDSSNEMVKCTLTLYEDFDSGEFEIHIDDGKGEKLTSNVPELALEAENNKLICVDENGDEVEIELLGDSLEKLEDVLKGNLLN